MPKIGSYTLDNKLILAPMAGVTDLPFRQLCRKQGAAMAVSEMVIADTRFWNSSKSRFRLNHTGEPSPKSVQIAGAEPAMLAQAAIENVRRGAEIIDINMGCPAKKVCNKAAGSALMRDEPLVEAILKAVVKSVDVPVTLKMRTGWSPDEKNALRIAKIAESLGIAAIAVHGRTRQCGYSGNAEYDTIARIKQSVSIPVFANGDIDSPEKARQVLLYTGADGLLIGRAAQGRPWIFNEINHYLDTGTHLPALPQDEVGKSLLSHVLALHEFYGDVMGVRIARKHVGWYLKNTDNQQSFRAMFNLRESAREQLVDIEGFFGLKGTMQP
jgi:tRNA-dihydrouridine synthase B